MALEMKAIRALIRSTPPRCLKPGRAEFLSAPTKPSSDLITNWRLVCPCGSQTGHLLGHPLTKLNPKIDDDDGFFVSPFTFVCATCTKRNKFLDTAVDGTGAELAKLAQAKIGNCCYRGKGRAERYACPRCTAPSGTIRVWFYFNQDYMFNLDEDGIVFPWQNLFSGVHVFFTCADCAKETMVTDLDTKY